MAYSKLQGDWYWILLPYPAQTNGNYFSAAFSENQQHVRYYHSHTQKCFFKLHMAFILDSTTRYIDTLQLWPAQLSVWGGATAGMVLPPHHCSTWRFEWEVSHQGTWLVIYSVLGYYIASTLVPSLCSAAVPDTTCCSSMPLLTLSKTFNIGAFTRIACCLSKYNPSSIMPADRMEEKT